MRGLLERVFLGIVSVVGMMALVAPPADNLHAAAWIVVTYFVGGSVLHDWFGAKSGGHQ